MNKIVMNTKRFLSMMATAAMLAVVMTACSSDEEKDTNNRIDLSFRLLNENGEETTTFRKGENIIFDLKIANNCDTKMIFTLEKFNDWVSENGISDNGADMFFPVSNEDFFSVYDSEGNKIGIPYTGIFCKTAYETLYCKAVDSHSEYHVRCNWKESEEFGPNANVTYPLCKFDSLDDLPVGEYYVSFTIKYRNQANDRKSKFKNVTFKYQFWVR